MTTGDVAIIGGGPAGAGAALALARHGVTVTVVDPLGIGGQLINLDWALDVPGFPDGVAGWDLAADLGEQVLDAGASLVMGEARGLHAAPGGAGPYAFSVDGTEHRAAAVLIATGCRPAPLPGAEDLEGRGVSYCAACDGALFAGRAVAVIGSGDEAAAEAVSLASVAASVTVLCPEASLGAGASWTAALRAAPSPITCVPNAHELTVVRAGPNVLGVAFRAGAGGDRHELTFDGIFGALPRLAAVEVAAALVAPSIDGLTADERCRVAGRPGLFVAGDVRAGARRRVAAATEAGRAAAQAIIDLLG